MSIKKKINTQISMKEFYFTVYRVSAEFLKINLNRPTYGTLGALFFFVFFPYQIF